MPSRRAAVRAPGTCGELVQGSLEGIPFHVTCPIAVYSQATVTVGSNLRDLQAPAWARKARHGLHLTWQRLMPERRPGVLLELSSPLARGKGLGSSTADVAAAASALALALGKPLTAEALTAIMLGVEPSDGSFLEGIALFDHRGGLIREQLTREPPPLEILVLDCGGEVDTEEFNRADHSRALRRAEPAVREALQFVRQGLARGDRQAIAEGAMISAVANQAILYKPQLHPVIAVAREVGALGVNCAHSGTVLGLLLKPDGSDHRDVVAHVRRRLPDVAPMFVTQLTGGGLRLPDPALTADASCGRAGTGV